MRRRTLLTVGTTTGLLLAAAGGALALLRPVRSEGRFAADAQPMLAAVAQSVLGPLLPPGPPLRESALQAQLHRLELTIAGFAPAMQAEVDELFGLLLHPAGRVALFGLGSAWSSATPGEVTDCLQALRTSSLGLRQQVFHALRDLNNAAWFADPDNWAAIGYPGPFPVGRA